MRAPNATRQNRVYRRGDPGRPNIALTFDDGPDNKWTPMILDILKSNNVKATFFVLGKAIDKYPSVFQRIIAEGHVVGNHSYSHTNLTKLSPPQINAEINLAADRIKKFTGKQPLLLRPPFGAYDAQVLKIAAANGLSIILWSVDPQDWRGLNAATIEARIIPVVKNGDIIILHSGEGIPLSGMVTALPTIISQLRAKGFNFVTIPALLSIPAYS